MANYNCCLRFTSRTLDIRKKKRIKNCIRQICMRKCIKNLVGEHHVQTQVPFVPTQPFQRPTSRPRAPLPLNLHKNYTCSLFNLKQTQIIKRTIDNALSKKRFISPSYIELVISSKFYLFRLLSCHQIYCGYNAILSIFFAFLLILSYASSEFLFKKNYHKFYDNIFKYVCFETLLTKSLNYCLLYWEKNKQLCCKHFRTIDDHQ